MRIIAGAFKGLNLYSFKEGNIRPTADKVRQAVFNSLQFSIAGSSFFYLFAGTGGISLEAMSRGARVVTVEKDNRSLRLIKKNFAKAKAESNLYAMDYMQAIKKLQKEGRQFDTIYVDPPFDSDFLEKALAGIVKHNLLKAEGLIICEHEEHQQFSLPSNLAVKNQKRYGSIMLTYLILKDNHV